MEKKLNRTQIQDILNQAPKELKTEEILNSLVEKGYTLEGFNEPKPSSIQKLGTELKQRGTDLASAVSTVGKGMSEAKTLPEVGKVLTRGLVRSAGAAAGATLDTLGTGVELADKALGEVPSTALKAGSEAFFATETGKKALASIQKGAESYNAYKVSNPEGAKDLESVMDIANVFPAVKAVSIAGKTALNVAKTGLKASATAGEAATNLLKSKIVNTPEKAVSNFQSNLLEQIEGKKVTKNQLLSKRTDVLDTIAKDPRYHPEIDIENKRFNTDIATKNINTDIEELANSTKNLFKEADTALGGINTKEVTDNLSKNLLDISNAPKYVVLGEAPFKEASTMLKRLTSTYGETIPREALWEVRKAVDSAVNKMADTDLKKQLRQDVRKSFESTLETSLGKDNKLVANLMGEMQRRIEARDYLEKTLNATTITGGKLTDLIRNALAGNVGAAAGAGVGGTLGSNNGVAGGLAGAVAGYAFSSKVGRWLAKNTLTNTFDRKALKKLIAEKPSVLKEVEEYVNTLKGTEKTRAMKNLKDLN